MPRLLREFKMTQKLLKESEINIKNIRLQFYEIETVIQELEEDVQVGKEELNHWKERRESLLQKMTSEQRSLVLDDFDEIPHILQKTLETVKSQEAAQ